MDKEQLKKNVTVVSKEEGVGAIPVAITLCNPLSKVYKCVSIGKGLGFRLYVFTIV